MIQIKCPHGHWPQGQGCPVCSGQRNVTYEQQPYVPPYVQPSEEVQLLRQISEDLKAIRRDLETIRTR
jgi:hypothetical protein